MDIDLLFRSIFSTSKEWTKYVWVIDDQNLYLYNDTGATRSQMGRGAPKKTIPLAYNLKMLKVKPKEYKGDSYAIVCGLVAEDWALMAI